jgi:ParB/RepB/Spo0J family partition protein
MTARGAWQPGDLSPDARRAAETAAEAAGVPLADWFAESVRAAIIRELGSLPAEDPTPERVEAVVEAPERVLEPAKTPISIANLDRPSPAAPDEKAAPERLVPATDVASVNSYRARRVSLEAQRLAASGLSGWLAARIEGLPAGTPAGPSAAKSTSAESASPPASMRPQLDLFSAAPAPSPAEPTPKAAPDSAAPPAPEPALPTEPLAPVPPPAPTPVSTPVSPASPPQTIPPLSLPVGPVVTLAVMDLRPAPIRARRPSDVDAAIPALAASVAVQGVREPILVRRLVEDAHHYEVVAGERRRLAAERVGRADLPAVLVEADDSEALMLSLAENLGRGDFSPLDEGRAYLRLLTEYRVNPSVLAQRLARERSHIVLALRLLGLPEKVRRAIDNGRLAPAQAYVLLSAPDPEAMAEQMMQGRAPEAAPGSA